MPETAQSDLVERLLAYRPYAMDAEDRYHHAICDEAADEIIRLRAELSAACGYLMNAKIDLETGCSKRTAVATIEGALRRFEAYRGEKGA